MAKTRRSHSHQSRGTFRTAVPAPETDAFDRLIEKMDRLDLARAEHLSEEAIEEARISHEERAKRNGRVDGDRAVKETPTERHGRIIYGRFLVRQKINLQLKERKRRRDRDRERDIIIGGITKPGVEGGNFQGGW